MLAKVPPKRNDGGTSFGKLGQYISRYDAGAELRHEFASPELEAQVAASGSILVQPAHQTGRRGPLAWHWPAKSSASS